MTAALMCRDLHASLGGQEVLHGVNVSLAAGRWTSIVGPNGAGKSTLLRVLAGLLPAQGEVYFFNQPLNEITPRERAKQMAWLGQNEQASDDLRVFDVVMLGRLPHQDWLAPPSAQDLLTVEQALQATQAWEWRDRNLGQLSGGERQRVLLARAMAVKAEVMLMDEPLTNLDPPHQVDWLEQMHCLLLQGKTVVSVLHEVGMALHAHDMVVMQGGRVVHQGACADAQTHRAVEAVFDQRIAIHSVGDALSQQWVALPRLIQKPL